MMIPWQTVTEPKPSFLVMTEVFIIKPVLGIKPIADGLLGILPPAAFVLPFPLIKRHGRTAVQTQIMIISAVINLAPLP